MLWDIDNIAMLTMKRGFREKYKQTQEERNGYTVKYDPAKKSNYRERGSIACSRKSPEPKKPELLEDEALVINEGTELGLKSAG